MKILLVDDETALTNPLRQVLHHEGYQVDVAQDGLQGKTLALTQTYDLLILDWMLPGLSGIELCRSLRSQGQRVPVLFLTAKDTLDDRVMGLDAGADDYLIKPFELRELLARVRAIFRRQSSEPGLSPQRLEVSDLELDQDNQIAYRQTRIINLSDKETRLLALFLQYPGQLLTHDQIYHYLWTDTETPGSNVVAALIRLLRRKIETGEESPLIHTVYGKGYRLGEGES